MEITPLKYLDLRSPLFYLAVDNLPSIINRDDEFLLHYELNPLQSQSIEPVREQLPGTLVFTGYKSSDFSRQAQDKSAQTVVLPAGEYLFTQRRLNAESPSDFYTDWLDLAVEQQKDGLWERYRLENKLYVRYLFEDGGFVTQVFRTAKT